MQGAIAVWALFAIAPFVAVGAGCAQPPAISDESAVLSAPAPETCLHEVRQWVRWSDAEFEYQPEKTTEPPVSIAYTFEAPDREEEVVVTIQGLRIRSLRWADKQLREELHARFPPLGSLAETPSPPRAWLLKRQSAADTFVREYWPEAGRTLQRENGGHWRGFATDGTEIDRTVVVRPDLANNKPCDVLELTPAQYRAPAAPISLTEACDIARRAFEKATPFHRFPEVKSARRTPENSGPVVNHMLVHSDDLGATRVAYLIVGHAWPKALPVRRYWALPEDDWVRRQYHSAVGVDAATGEVFPVLPSEPGIVPRVEDLPVARVRIGPRAFSLAFLPKIVRGVPHFCVVYFDSAIWPGKVELEGETAEVKYAGRTWTLTAGRTSATVDGRQVQLADRPLMLGGYMYLPPSVINELTGWHVAMRTDGQGEVVCVYSHRKGEEPPAAVAIAAEARGLRTFALEPPGDGDAP